MARFAQERFGGDARQATVALRAEPARAAGRSSSPQKNNLVATARGVERRAERGAEWGAVREEAGGLRRPSSEGEKQEAEDEHENALARLKKSYLANRSLLAETAAKIAAYDAAKSD